QVGLLGLGDLPDLVPGHRADLVLVRLARALLHAGGLQQQLRRGRGLELEVERAVLVDGDLHRHHVAALRLGRGVVGLAELHDVDAVLTQRRADRRSRVGLARGDLQLDDRRQLLLLGWHVVSLCVLSSRAPAVARAPASSAGLVDRQILETWWKPSSTGVSRPKIDTSTLSFWATGLTSEIVAGSVDRKSTRLHSSHVKISYAVFCVKK